MLKAKKIFKISKKILGIVSLCLIAISNTIAVSTTPDIITYPRALFSEDILINESSGSFYVSMNIPTDENIKRIKIPFIEFDPNLITINTGDVTAVDATVAEWTDPSVADGLAINDMFGKRYIEIEVGRLGIIPEWQPDQDFLNWAGVSKNIFKIDFTVNPGVDFPAAIKVFNTGVEVVNDNGANLAGSYQWYTDMEITKAPKITTLLKNLVEILLIDEEYTIDDLVATDSINLAFTITDPAMSSLSAKWQVSTDWTNFSDAVSWTGGILVAGDNTDSSINISFAEPGKHYLQLVVTADIDEVTTSYPIELNIKPQAPDLSIPLSGTYTNQDPFNFTVTGTGTSLEVFIDNVSKGNLNGSWQLVTNVSFAGQGTESFDIKLETMEGIESAITTLEVTYDSIDPVINITDDVTGSFVQSETVVANITEINSSIIKYGFVIDSADCITSIDTSSFVNYSSGADIIINTETYNDQYVCFYAEDAATNNAVAVSGQIKVDITDSVITIVWPAAGVAQEKTITASATDNIGVITLEMKELTNVSDACDGNTGYVVYADSTFNEETDNGKAMCYKATDEAGNIAYNKSGEITNIVQRVDITGNIKTLGSNVAVDGTGNYGQVIALTGTGNYIITSLEAGQIKNGSNETIIATRYGSGSWLHDGTNYITCEQSSECLDVTNIAADGSFTLNTPVTGLKYIVIIADKYDKRIIDIEEMNLLLTDYPLALTSDEERIHLIGDFATLNEGKDGSADVVDLYKWIEMVEGIPTICYMGEDDGSEAAFCDPGAMKIFADTRYKTYPDGTLGDDDGARLYYYTSRNSIPELNPFLLTNVENDEWIVDFATLNEGKDGSVNTVDLYKWIEMVEGIPTICYMGEDDGSEVAVCDPGAMKVFADTRYITYPDNILGDDDGARLYYYTSRNSIPELNPFIVEILR